uniref:Putative ovule protein n=1 Tax=Solanum chacoense TaxID=4108 RepID=A0A0V0HFA2_SOLCH
MLGFLTYGFGLKTLVYFTQTIQNCLKVYFGTLKISQSKRNLNCIIHKYISSGENNYKMKETDNVSDLPQFDIHVNAILCLITNIHIVTYRLLSKYPFCLQFIHIDIHELEHY